MIEARRGRPGRGPSDASTEAVPTATAAHACRAAAAGEDLRSGPGGAVSQAFHIRRAVALCDAAGVDSYGVGVDDKHDTTWYYGGTREVFAAGKAALNAVFHPAPTFLGPKEQGVARALASAR